MRVSEIRVKRIRVNQGLGVGLVLTLYNFQMGLEISNHCASINTILVSIVFGETIFHSK